MSSYILRGSTRGVRDPSDMQAMFGSRAQPILSYTAKGFDISDPYVVWEVPLETPDARRILRGEVKRRGIYPGFAFSKESLPRFLSQRVFSSHGMMHTNGRLCFGTTVRIEPGYEKMVLKALHAALRERQRMDYEESCAMACYVTATEKLRIPTPEYRKGLIYQLRFLTPVQVPKRKNRGFFELSHITVPAHGKDVIPSGKDIVWTPLSSLRNPVSLMDYMQHVSEYFDQHPHPPRDRMYVAAWYKQSGKHRRSMDFQRSQWRYRKPKSASKKGWKFMLTRQQ